jgi:ubiquinone/menaquinone biosynthesis C-methylase UbiE
VRYDARMSSIARLCLALTLSAVALVGCEQRQSPPPSPPSASPAPVPSPSPPPAAAAADATPAGAGGASANPGINDRFKNPETLEAAAKSFDGPERAAFQTPTDVLAKLKLRPGEVVADIGAGSGYLTPALSKAVGPKGKVYAEDIFDAFLAHVRAKVKDEKLSNVEVVLGTEKDVKLPEACCDVVVILDTYHHFEWPEPMMASIRKATKPGGRLYIIEFHRRPNPLFEVNKVDYKTHIQLDDKQVVAQLEKLGWKNLELKDFPPYQYIAVFTPAAATK